MLTLSDASLRRTLEPAVVVMSAFKKASSWHAVCAAWTASKLSDRLSFLSLCALFTALGITCVWINNGWLFGLALILGATGALIFRYRIVDRHPLRNTYGQLDSYFGLNYRFRRYLIFRSELQSEGIDFHTIAKVRRLLVIESKLRESRSSKPGFAAAAVVSIVVSLLTTLGTQEYLIKSGSTLLILFVCVTGLYFYTMWKSVFPGHLHAQNELECFLSWHEEEFSSVENTRGK